MRIAELTRTTKETDIALRLNLDGTGKSDIQTGIGFFDHMLTALTLHSGFDLTLRAEGDLEVDCHHLIEDTGIILGQALAKALGDKAGIARYGTAFLPMDEALARVSLDLSNRAYLVFNADFLSEKIGDFDTQMVEEFFRAFAVNGGITLHAEVLYGRNDHHKVEALFKALAQALKQAVAANGTAPLSTKGTL